eukprot:TRINITY_DN5001_c0_g2_i9.p1 TRINITY_DN5001_c0_g2~~TRINITY_DN5001_c0_g2_i9.p1  ORF type:complete len:220 (-),score=-16.87 TRINITY_DN5001_c0_g2_i9:470-1129(-)
MYSALYTLRLSSTFMSSHMRAFLKYFAMSQKQQTQNIFLDPYSLVLCLQCRWQMGLCLQIISLQGILILRGNFKITNFWSILVSQFLLGSNNLQAKLAKKFLYSTVVVVLLTRITICYVLSLLARNFLQSECITNCDLTKWTQQKRSKVEILDLTESSQKDLCNNGKNLKFGQVVCEMSLFLFVVIRFCGGGIRLLNLGGGPCPPCPCFLPLWKYDIKC